MSEGSAQQLDERLLRRMRMRADLYGEEHAVPPMSEAAPTLPVPEIVFTRPAWHMLTPEQQDAKLDDLERRWRRRMQLYGQTEEQLQAFNERFDMFRRIVPGMREANAILAKKAGYENAKVFPFFTPYSPDRVNEALSAASDDLLRNMADNFSEAELAEMGRYLAAAAVQFDSDRGAVGDFGLSVKRGADQLLYEGRSYPLGTMARFALDVDPSKWRWMDAAGDPLAKSDDSAEAWKGMFGLAIPPDEVDLPEWTRFGTGMAQDLGLKAGEDLYAKARPLTEEEIAHVQPIIEKFAKRRYWEESFRTAYKERTDELKQLRKLGPFKVRWDKYGWSDPDNPDRPWFAKKLPRWLMRHSNFELGGANAQGWDWQDQSIGRGFEIAGTSVPYLGAFLVPGGQAVIASSFAHQGEIRLHDIEVEHGVKFTPEQVAQITMAEGITATAVERMFGFFGLKALSPVRALNKASGRLRGGAAANVTSWYIARQTIYRTLETTIGEGVEEWAQQSTNYFYEALFDELGALDLPEGEVRSMRDYVETTLNPFLDQGLEMFMGMFLLSMAGAPGNISTLQEAKARQEILQNETLLLAYGIDPATAQKIVAETDPYSAVEMFRRAQLKADPTTEIAREALAKANTEFSETTKGIADQRRAAEAKRRHELEEMAELDAASMEGARTESVKEGELEYKRITKNGQTIGIELDGHNYQLESEEDFQEFLNETASHRETMAILDAQDALLGAGHSVQTQGGRQWFEQRDLSQGMRESVVQKRWEMLDRAEVKPNARESVEARRKFINKMYLSELAPELREQHHQITENVLGRTFPATIEGQVVSVTQMMKGESLMEMTEEGIHQWSEDYVRARDSGYEFDGKQDWHEAPEGSFRWKMAQWREQIEAEVGEMVRWEWNDEGMHEWFAEAGQGFLWLNQKKVSKSFREHMELERKAVELGSKGKLVKMPAEVMALFRFLADRLADLIARASKIVKGIREGRIDEGFEQAVLEALGLDETTLQGMRARLGDEGFDLIGAIREAEPGPAAEAAEVSPEEFEQALDTWVDEEPVPWRPHEEPVPWRPRSEGGLYSVRPGLESVKKPSSMLTWIRRNMDNIGPEGVQIDYSAPEFDDHTDEEIENIDTVVTLHNMTWAVAPARGGKIDPSKSPNPVQILGQIAGGKLVAQFYVNSFNRQQVKPVDIVPKMKVTGKLSGEGTKARLDILFIEPGDVFPNYSAAVRGRFQGRVSPLDEFNAQKRLGPDDDAFLNAYYRWYAVPRYHHQGQKFLESLPLNEDERDALELLELQEPKTVFERLTTDQRKEIYYYQHKDNHLDVLTERAKMVLDGATPAEANEAHPIGWTVKDWDISMEGRYQIGVYDNGWRFNPDVRQRLKIVEQAMEEGASEEEAISQALEALPRRSIRGMDWKEQKRHALLKTGGHLYSVRPGLTFSEIEERNRAIVTDNGQSKRIIQLNPVPEDFRTFARASGEEAPTSREHRLGAAADYLEGVYGKTGQLSEPRDELDGTLEGEERARERTLLVRLAEAQVLRQFAKDNGLMLDSAEFEQAWREQADPSRKSLWGNGLLGGQEHHVVFDYESGEVRKRYIGALDVNPLATYYNYFNRQVVFSYFWPETGYELEGFVEWEGESVQAQIGEKEFEVKKILMPVVRQRLVADHDAKNKLFEGDPEADRLIDEHFSELGFKKRKHRTYEYEYEGGVILVSDVHEANMLRRDGGSLVPVDLDVEIIPNQAGNANQGVLFSVRPAIESKEAEIKERIRRLQPQEFNALVRKVEQLVRGHGNTDLGVDAPDPEQALYSVRPGLDSADEFADNPDIPNQQPGSGENIAQPSQPVMSQAERIGIRRKLVAVDDLKFTESEQFNLDGASLLFSDAQAYLAELNLPQSELPDIIPDLAINERNEILDGHNRSAKALELGVPELNAIVIPDRLIEFARQQGFDLIEIVAGAFRAEANWDRLGEMSLDFHGGDIFGRADEVFGLWWKEFAQTDTSAPGHSGALYAIRPGIEARYFSKHGKPTRELMMRLRQRLAEMKHQAYFKGNKAGATPDSRQKLIEDLRELRMMHMILPPEVRGKLGGYVRLADMYQNAPQRRRAFLNEQLDKVETELESWLRDEYELAIAKALNRRLPEVKDGKKKGKNIGAEASAQLEQIREFMDMTAEELEKAIEDAEAEQMALTQKDQDDDAQAKIEEREGFIVAANFFGNLENKTADSRADILDEINRIIEQGRLAWEVLQEERLARNEELRETMLDSITGGKGQLLDEEAKKREEARAQSLAFKLDEPARKIANWAHWLKRAERENTERESLYGGPLTKWGERLVHDATHTERRKNFAWKTDLFNLLYDIFGIKPKKTGNLIAQVRASKKLAEMSKREKVKVFRVEERKHRAAKVPIPLSQQIREDILNSDRFREVEAGDDGTIEIDVGPDGGLQAWRTIQSGGKTWTRRAEDMMISPAASNFRLNRWELASIMEALEEHERQYQALTRELADLPVTHVIKDGQQQETYLDERQKKRAKAIRAKLSGMERRQFLEYRQVTDPGIYKQQYMSQFELIDAATGFDQDPSSFNLWGWSEESREQIEAALTDEAKQLRELFYQGYETAYTESVNPIYRRVYGVNLPRTGQGRYAPMERVRNNQQDMDLLDRQIQASGTSPAFIHARVTNSLEPKIQNAFEKFERHMLLAHHYAAWAEPLRELRAVLTHKDIQKAIREYQGNHVNQAIQKRLQWFSDGGVRSNFNWKLLSTFRRKMAILSLAWKWQIGLKQITSAPAYMFEVPVHKFLQYQAEFFLHPIKNTKFLAGQPFVKERFAGGTFDRDVMAAIRLDHFNPSFWRAFEESGMVVTKIGDIIPIVTAGYAAYRYGKEQAELADPSLTPEQAEAEGITFWEMATERAQQAGDLKDLGDFDAGNDIQRMFTLFRTTPKQYFLNVYEAWLDVRAKRKGAWPEFARRFIIGHLLLAIIFSAVSQILASIGTDDDQEEKGWGWFNLNLTDLLYAALWGPNSGVPVVGDAGMVATKGLINEGIDSYNELNEDGVRLSSVTSYGYENPIMDTALEVPRIWREVEETFVDIQNDELDLTDLTRPVLRGAKVWAHSSGSASGSAAGVITIATDNVMRSFDGPGSEANLGQDISRALQSPRDRAKMVVRDYKKFRKDWKDEWLLEYQRKHSVSRQDASKEFGDAKSDFDRESVNWLKQRLAGLEREDVLLVREELENTSDVGDEDVRRKGTRIPSPN